MSISPRNAQIREVRLVKEWLQMPAWTEIMRPLLEKEYATTIEKMLGESNPHIELELKADARAIKRFLNELDQIKTIKS